MHIRSLFLGLLVAGSLMAAGPAIAALDPLQQFEVAAEPDYCEAPASTDFAMEVRVFRISDDPVSCEPALLAETGLCLEPVNVTLGNVTAPPGILLLNHCLGRSPPG